MRPRGIKNRVWEVYSPEPHVEVYCLQLNFKILKVTYFAGMKRPNHAILTWQKTKAWLTTQRPKSCANLPVASSEGQSLTIYTRTQFGVLWWSLLQLCGRASELENRNRLIVPFIFHFSGENIEKLNKFRVFLTTPTFESEATNQDTILFILRH